MPVAIAVDLLILLVFKRLDIIDPGSNFLILTKVGMGVLVLLSITFGINYTVFQADMYNFIPLVMFRFMIYFPISIP